MTWKLKYNVLKGLYLGSGVRDIRSHRQPISSLHDATCTNKTKGLAPAKDSSAHPAHGRVEVRLQVYQQDGREQDSIAAGLLPGSA